jgi:ABC-type multidrug transport system fused ATPase/permease subunit
MGDEIDKLLPAENIKGKIEFKNVWFRNPNDRTHFILKGVNFVI